MIQKIGHKNVDAYKPWVDPRFTNGGGGGEGAETCN